MNLAHTTAGVATRDYIAALRETLDRACSRFVPGEGYWGSDTPEPDEMYETLARQLREVDDVLAFEIIDVPIQARILHEILWICTSEIYHGQSGGRRAAREALDDAHRHLGLPPVDRSTWIDLASLAEREEAGR